MKKLSISNIAWSAENDNTVYSWMVKHAYSGLEIAPTRIFTESPYDSLQDAKTWSDQINKEYGFVVPSMQSIWFGRQENMFNSDEELRKLIDYTKKAIIFAQTIKCRNLVFGCPRNRNIAEGRNSDVAIDFFKEIGDYAAEHGTIIGMEANPSIYNTNYINNTASALTLIKTVDSKGFKLNLDVGTMIQNDETVNDLIDNVKYINHVHVSEPGLKAITERKLHNELYEILKSEKYDGFVSIEMGRTEDLSIIEKTMIYIKEVFSNS